MGNLVSTVRGSRAGNDCPQIASEGSQSTARSSGQTAFASDPALSSPRHSALPESWRGHAQQQLPSHLQLINGQEDETISRSYEHESHPLFQRIHDSSAEIRSGRPATRRYSTMSRLSSRLLPESIAHGMTDNGEQNLGESQRLRHGLSNRSRTDSFHRRITSISSDRFSIAGSIRRRAQDPRSDTSRNAVRRLLHPESDPLENGFELSTAPSQDFASTLPNRQSMVQVPRRSGTRLSRMRNSLSAPISAILGSSYHRSSSTTRMQSPPPRSSRIALTENSDELLPQPSSQDIRSESDDNMPHELDAVEPETRNFLSSSRTTNSTSTNRRASHTFRSRSTRLIRRGEHPPLSQVLQLAAAAIAAQLSGTSVEASDGSRSLGGDTFDGSIQNFVQTLQDAASAQAGDNVDLHASDGELPPVNFMRVFQFPNDENGSPLPFPPTQQMANEFDATHTNGGSDRSVTLVLVGVRSMPNVHDESTGENGTLGPSLDTLLSLPFLPQANILRNSTSGALFRRSDSRYRSQSRRHSMTNFNFPQQYESQRHMRTRSSNLRNGEGSVGPSHNLPIPMSESPPGPNPPPSTPADIRSGNATPIRRPSSASMAHTPGLPDLDEDQDNAVPTLPAESAFSTARQRRRSDSEFARRPELSSGNSRRNGVVEPDRPAPGAGRSWLIYVVGTNVSPDHPAFTMPSLFTENPTYEDMQMLSTLLGPVKPPVATLEDVETAGGLYHISSRDGTLVAEPATDTNTQVLGITAGDRCLICLSDYEENDHVRQIYSCGHMYHRECIDEWLTTGRNSCPMCRGQGVKEGRGSSSAETNESRNTNIT